MSKRVDEEYSDEETERRAEEALRGAFKTPPISEKKKDVREQKRRKK